jgi:general stress protein 26
MSQIEVPYDELKQEIIEELKNREWCYLATSKEDNVRVSYMRIVSNGLTVWCYTDHRSRKYKQIMANQKVGIADKNLQIEGIATLKGHPLDEENADYIKSYRENQPENYERTSKRQFQRSRPEFRVIEVQPSRISLIKLGATAQENMVFILDIAKKKAYRFEGNTNFESPAYQEYN